MSTFRTRLSSCFALLLGLAPDVLAGATNGTPYSWPYQDALALPADATNIVAIDASILGPIALRADGTVLTWEGSPPPPPGLSNVVAIAAGDVFHLALTADGRPVAWGGFHAEGVAITTPPNWLTNVVAISAGYDHSVALTSDGLLIPWGANSLGVLNAPARSFKPRSFSAGQQTVLVIEENGRPSGWGTDQSGIRSFPIALSNAVQISASPFMHALGLRADGRVFAWGNNGDRQTQVPASATNIVQVCAAPHWSLALRDDGNVLIWGQPGAVWTTPPFDPIRMFAIAAGNNQNYGLTRAPVRRDIFWSTNLPAGSTLTLSRDFIGSDPFEVQWFLNNQPIPGSSNRILNLTNLQASDAGRYHLVASNAFGSVTSLPIDVAVTPAPPRIVGEPESLAVTRGAEASFSVRALGTDPMMFQWYFNEQPIPGETNAFLRLGSVSSTNDGRYHVFISNGLGTATSHTAVLSTGNPVFGKEPTSFHGLSGRPVRLEARVLSPEPQSLSWWLGTNRIEGVDGPRLDLPAISPALTGEYLLVASNSFGVVTSRIAHVSIRAPQPPLAQPMAAVAANIPQVLPPGFTNVLDARMLWAGEHSYAVGIRPDRTLMAWGAHPFGSGPANPVPNSSNVMAFAIGYSHVVTLLGDGRIRGWGNVVYNGLWTPTEPSPPLQDVVEVAATDQLCLALRANGELVTWPSANEFPKSLPPLAAISAYQNTVGALLEDGSVWLWDARAPQDPTRSDPMEAVAIAASDDYILVLRRDQSMIRLHRGGSMNVLPRIEGNPTIAEIAVLGRERLARTTDGTVWRNWSDLAGVWAPWKRGLSGVTRLSSGLGTTFAFTEAPFIHGIEPPASLLVHSTLRLSAEISSASPARLQWTRDNVPLAGRTNATVVIDSISYSDAGAYAIIVSNDRASLTSAPVVVTVMGVPEIPRPLPLFALAGEDVILRPTVYGSEPLQYQWYFRGRAIAGANDPTLALPNLQAEATGNYEIQVTNPFGTVWGAGLPVGIQPSTPRIPALTPDSLTVLEGAPLRLPVEVRGTEPIRYQWFHQGQPRPDQTNAALFLQVTAASDAGAWHLQAVNGVGTSTSASLQVAVSPTEPRILQQDTWRLANAGNPFAWTPTIAGSAPLRLQWKKDGTDIPGATNAALAFASVSTNDSAVYTLHLSNHLGQATSSLMQLVARPGNGPGAIVTWGSLRPPMDFGVIQDFTIGSLHAHAVLADGTVRSWVIGNVPDLYAPKDLTDAVSVAAGSGFAMALRSDGTVRVWSSPAGVLRDMPSGLGRVTAIAAGNSHAVALLENGVPFTWGFIPGGRTNTPASATNIVAISARASHNLGLRRDGTVVSWGPSPSIAVPAAVSNVISIAAFPNGGTAVRSDRRAISWGTAPAPTSSLTNVISVAAGASHGLAVRPDGSMAAWGSNLRGQATVPAGLTNVVATFAYQDTSAAITRSPVFTSPAVASVVTAQVGDEVRLAPTVHGLGPISYQWLANDRPVDGQTNATLVLSSVSPDLDAFYTLRASNAWLTVVSPSIRLSTIGRIEMRWNLTNATIPRLWVRAPGSPFLRLQQSTTLDSWTSIGTYPIAAEGSNIDLDPAMDLESLFFRLASP